MVTGRLAERYKRNQKSISLEDQAKLTGSHVAVVGCGGLGGYLAEEFARLGVGHLLLIDGDRFEVSNLNRQLYATENTLGQWKVVVCKERLKAVNSEVEVDIVKSWFREEDANYLLQRADGQAPLDLVCDALDNIPARLALERACHALNIPLLFEAIGGWYGQLGFSFPGDFSIARLFGKSEQGVEKVLGNPAFTPAVVASLAVAESVKYLTGKPVTLRRSWLMVDLFNMEFDRFEILADDDNKKESS